MEVAQFSKQRRKKNIDRKELLYKIMEHSTWEKNYETSFMTWQDIFFFHAEGGWKRFVVMA